MEVKKSSYLEERKFDFLHSTFGKECGYDSERIDSFAVLHPANEEEGKKYPLYVVFHSAGHSLHLTVGTLEQEGNHDIYHAPRDMYALYVDCFSHKETDWWWGGINAQNEGDESRRNTELQPVEKRILMTVEWVIDNYPIDKKRIYAVGNSMGGSGALGIAFRRGDLFTAIVANVPAGVEHMNYRCKLLDDDDSLVEFDPPVVVDYSAQNDMWSNGHEKLYAGMKKKKYALVGYWGPFGHANNYREILRTNDLVLCYNPLGLKTDEAYPAFTNTSTDDKIPWPDNLESKESGQLNAFFRWNNISDEKNKFEMNIRLMHKDEWQTSREIPDSSLTDVTLRRIQSFEIKPGEIIKYSYGDESGEVVADKRGKVTIPGIKVTKEDKTLKLTK